MNKTSIEWTEYTWNPVTGCTKISAGCRSCYAETMATRFWGTRKFTDVQMHPERLVELRKSHRKLDGKKVFVCDVSDLFHEKVSFDFIDSIFNEFYFLPNTTFQILTKRPERAVEFFKSQTNYVALPNVWIGTSVENQEQADKRIPLLLQIPASVRFLSCEPLIGEVDLNLFTGVNRETLNMIHWVIAGGESGHQARPMHPDWVRSLRDQCQAANVPFFFKQWGEWVDNANMPWEYLHLNNLKHHVFNDSVFATEVWKLGKAKSGNMLDGKQHLEFPNI